MSAPARSDGTEEMHKSVRGEDGDESIKRSLPWGERKAAQPYGRRRNGGDLAVTESLMTPVQAQRPRPAARRESGRPSGVAFVNVRTLIHSGLSLFGSV